MQPPRHGLKSINVGLVLLLVANVVWAQQDATTKAEQADEDFSFLKIKKNSDDELVALQVAIVRYRPTNGDDHYVDLIGAIHVADESFFADLNKRFREYDAVLYELVAPEGTRIPRGGVPRESMVSMMQGGMTDVLGLAFQLDEIDYTRRNLIHADMSPEEFSQSMKDRGESVLGFFFRAMAQGMAQQARDPTRSDDFKLLAALFSADREHDLKVFMAEQFADMDNMMSVFGGKDGSTLVTERNRKALEVLRKQLAKPRRKRIAIFYGAGHMQDMEDQLEKDFGLQRDKVTWVTAWDLSAGLEKKKKRVKKSRSKASRKAG